MSNIEKYIYSLVIVLSVIIITTMLFGCTISFQNVSTNGKASDLIDEQQDANADVSPDISVPISAI